MTWSASRPAESIRLVLGTITVVFLVTAIAAGQGSGAQAVDSGQVFIRSAVYIPPGEALSVTSNLVETRVIVRGRAGGAIGGLTQADFTVLDNGLAQKIGFFQEESPVAGGRPLPRHADITGSRSSAGVKPDRRYIALFFDDIHTGAFGLRHLREAAARLIAEDLGEADQVGVFTNSGVVEQDFTPDKQALLAALGRLGPQSSGPQPFSVCPALNTLQAYIIARRLDPQATRAAAAEAAACNCPPPATVCKGCTAAQDSCVASQTRSVEATAETVWEMARPHSAMTLRALGVVLQKLARTPGERTLVLVSSGFVSGDLRRQSDELIAAALRNQVVVDSLSAEGLLAGAADPKVSSLVSNQVLSDLMIAAADVTGGRVVRNTNDFAAGFRALVAREVSYRIGFAPSTMQDGRYHRLTVRVRNCAGCSLSVRRGYFAAGQGSLPERVQDRIDREAVSDARMDEFPVRVRVETRPAEGNSPTVRVKIHLDIKGLRFHEESGRYIQQLTFVAVLRNGRGGYIDGKQAVMDLLLSPEKLLAMQATGLDASFSFRVPPGSYRLREVSREAVQNRWAASTTGFNAY